MKKLIQATALLTLSNTATRALSFIFFVLLARQTTINDYGLFRYFLALAGVFAISFTGIPSAISAFISKDKTNSNEYSINGLWIMFSALLVTLIPIILFQEKFYILIILLFAYWIDSFYLGFIQGHLNYFKIVGFKLVENIIQLTVLGISFYLFHQINLLVAVLFFSISGAISLFIFEFYQPQLKIKMNYSIDVIKKILRYSIPVTLGAIGWVVMTGINIIIIKHFYSPVEVAQFSVGLTLVQIFSFLPIAVSTIALPKVSAIKNKKSLTRPLIMSIYVTLATSLILLIILIIFGSLIVTNLFSTDYLGTLTVLFPLAIGQIAMGIHQIYASVWQGLNKPVVPTITIIIAGIINALSSLVMIPQLGIYGAAICYAASSIFAALIISVYFHTQWKTISKA